MSSNDERPDGDYSSAPPGLDLGLTEQQRELFDEFESLMALNTPLDRSTADLPRLWNLVDSKGHVSELLALIHSSAKSLSAPEQEAVLCLFPEHFSAESGNLTGRKRQAAQRIGKPYNTARARRDGQPNDFDRLLAALAASLDGATASVRRQAAIERSLIGPRPRVLSSTVMTAGGVALVLMAIVGLFLINVGRGDSSVSAGPKVSASSTAAEVAPLTISDPAAPHSGVATPSALSQAQAGRLTSCNRPVGGPLVPTDDNVWITQPMIEAYQAAVDHLFDLGCPSATAQSWGEAWYQFIDAREPSQAGTLVAWGGPGSTATTDGPVALFVPRTIWLAYWNAGLSAGQLSQSLAGFPIDFVVDDEGHWISHSTLGGLFITEQPNISARWIPHQAMPIWDSTGGIHGSLGLPMTNVEYVDGVITQTYERGKAFHNPDGEVSWEVYDQATIDAEVAALSRTTDGILSSYDSTDWWIDGSGVRHWIPSGPDHDDGALWECLGGLDNTITEGLDGWVIAAFPLGENATCSAS